MSLGIQTRTALTDEELARRYQATDDPEYFAQIFARHRRLVFCVCRRFFGCNSLAEDATQETFLRAYQAIHRFQNGNPPRAHRNEKEATAHRVVWNFLIASVPVMKAPGNSLRFLR
jgi:hypothetical protein